MQVWRWQHQQIAAALWLKDGLQAQGACAPSQGHYIHDGSHHKIVWQRALRQTHTPLASAACCLLLARSFQWSQTTCPSQVVRSLARARPRSCQVVRSLASPVMPRPVGRILQASSTTPRPGALIVLRLWHLVLFFTSCHAPPFHLAHATTSIISV